MCDDVQLVQKREKWSKSSSQKSKLWEKAHERNAKRVYNAIVGLEGLWVKAGQYMSTRADVLPNPYIEVLRQLQDSLPPRSLKEVSGYFVPDCFCLVFNFGIKQGLGCQSHDGSVRLYSVPSANRSSACYWMLGECDHKEGAG